MPQIYDAYHFLAILLAILLGSGVVVIYLLYVTSRLWQWSVKRFRDEMEKLNGS